MYIYVMVQKWLPEINSLLNSQVFENQNVKAIQLSQVEMKETQGEWGPVVAVIGGLGGGTVAGGTAGPMGVIWGFNAAIAGGTIRGVVAKNGW